VDGIKVAESLARSLCSFTQNPCTEHQKNL
jgi:hypothetical protein